MREENRLFFGLLRFTVGLLTITFILWGIYVLRDDNLPLAIVIFSVAVVVLTGGAFFISIMRNKVRRGEIIQDELSARITYKSGYIAFVSSILWWSFLISFIDDVDPPRFLMYGGLLGMFVIFGISYLIVKQLELR